MVVRDGCPLARGFPIRISWDRRSLGSSPRLIAACHVLRRLPAPRHPPCTLSNLTTIVLASRRPARWRGVLKLKQLRFEASGTHFPPLRLGPESADLVKHAIATQFTLLGFQRALWAGPSARLHYGPAKCGFGVSRHGTARGAERALQPRASRDAALVETSGFEPPTYWLQTSRSPN